MINTNTIVSASEFSGFQNYGTATFSTSVVSQGIAVGSYLGPLRATTPLNNTNSVSQVQIQYSGIDNNYRLLPGNLTIITPSAAVPSYEVESFSYFSGGTLYVDSYISNQTGSTVTIPSITFNCRAFLFLAPF